ncbi:MAG: hypothetical protein CMM07_20080 [Rhodopirellula sp.]|nr:hypothetical protein [Rhodopirellula sp.]
MAFTGILKGTAVGWVLISIPVIAYLVSWIVVLHFFVRPAEEKDLR